MDRATSMAGRGVATAAIVGIVVVLLVGAGVFGYLYLTPANQHSSTTKSQQSSVSTSQSVSSTTQGNVEITNAALSNTTLLVTIQNAGSQTVSINSLLITPGGGCPSTTTTTTTSQTNQTRPGFTLPPCFARAVVFLVQNNSTLKPVPIGRFNFSAGSFNSTRSFSRSGNFSRTISGNVSRTFSGNFSRGFVGGFPRNFSGSGGVQLAAGQSLTLAYSGAIGSGVAPGSQYTITVAGQQVDAQVTVSAS
jgi:hypothetical protein